MKCNKYLIPGYYVRGLWNHVPMERKTPLRYAGYYKLAFRKLCAPVLRYPVSLQNDEGIRFYVSTDPIDEKILFRLANRREDYFPRQIFKNLPENPVVLDVGAHHGFYTVHALGLFRDAKVICVEPVQTAVEKIQENLKLNGWEHRARIVRAALAEKAGKGTLKYCTRGSWGHSLFEEEQQTIGHETVPLMTLEQILQGDRPHIVKCNAEGAEFALVSQLIDLQLFPLLVSIYVHDRFGDMDSLLRDMRTAGYTAERFGSEDHPAFHFWLGRS